MQYSGREVRSIVLAGLLQILRDKSILAEEHKMLIRAESMRRCT